MAQKIEIIDKIFNPTKPNPIDFLRLLGLFAISIERFNDNSLRFLITLIISSLSAISLKLVLLDE